MNALQGTSQQQQQFEQASREGGMAGAGQQNLWGQGLASAPGPHSPFPQQNQGGSNINRAGGSGDGLRQASPGPRRLSPPPKAKTNPRLLFIVAGLCVFLGAMILGLIYILATSNTGGSSPNTASNNQNNTSLTATAQTGASSPTASSSASPTGTVYPGQQYVYGAQMATGVNKTPLQAKNPTTTFKVGTTMYVVFKLHPPSKGGAFCVYWYQSGKQVTTPYAYAVKAGTHGSYAYAAYGQAGSGYVELYWASTVSCSDQILAQHVDFTVTA
ncbi:MAG TPA: hypothetical protein VGD98_03730 [Ktedonobacteraceae bacterium]